VNANFDEDYLRELELWPHIALQRQGAAMAEPAVVEKSSAEKARVETRAAPDARPEATPVPRPGPAAPVAPPSSRVAGRPAPEAAPATAPVADPARVSRIVQLDWDGLKTESAACQACGLCKQRKQAVLGVGATDAPWLLVGEGPGADEDELGEPFVGQAGKLLDAMLTAAGLKRGREVYIANVVKCRPPGNRTPSTEEALACAPFLDRQIDLVKPKLIVALGKTAVTRLTGSEASMASLRGKMLEYRGIPVVATYHPSYMLRTPAEKLKSWEDLMFAKRAFVAATR